MQHILPALKKISEETKRPGFWETFGPYGKKQVVTVIDIIGVCLAYGNWDSALEELKDAIDNDDVTDNLEHIENTKAFLVDLLQRMEQQA